MVDVRIYIKFVAKYAYDATDNTHSLHGFIPAYHPICNYFKIYIIYFDFLPTCIR